MSELVLVLHPDDHALYLRAKEMAFSLATSVGLKLDRFEPKRRPLFGNATGLCYVKERRISVMIRPKHYADAGGGWHKKPLSWKIIRNVVAHEVAHLKHPNHSKDFKAYEKELVSKALEIDGKMGIDEKISGSG